MAKVNYRTVMLPGSKGSQADVAMFSNKAEDGDTGDGGNDNGDNAANNETDHHGEPTTPSRSALKKPVTSASPSSPRLRINPRTSDLGPTPLPSPDGAVKEAVEVVDVEIRR